MKKRKRLKLYSFILKGLIVAGFVIMVGTAGAGDVGSISFKQILIQSLLGVSMILIGLGALRSGGGNYDYKN